ncbi:DoxX family protein [Sporocytophaga myxococcoides]|uniref:DoxX family protein n=1 Tax=Sporocytophaga myxococcoides TaxID=153721 RepID=UPI0004185787|nr:DoxX family protein [Sporocytophaga myxococcoides]
MKYNLLVGRILFSLVFLLAIIRNFSSEAVKNASTAGVPWASIAVPLSGIIAFLGAVSIIIGYKAKIGAWLIVLYLLSATFIMHRFWADTDPMMQKMKMMNFMKNISMLGGALIISYWGAGPLSIDKNSNFK